MSELSRQSHPDALRVAIEAVERAKRAVDEAWTLTAEAMDAMRRVDAPVLVVERLGEARLRLHGTNEYREVLSLLAWSARHA